MFVVVALSSFVGREVDLGQLGDAVAAHRLVTVTGPGGVGKTRLVRELERGLQAADGPAVRWCRPPRAADADDALLDIVTQLGLAAVDAALFVLRDQPTLLVLDECEHDVVVAAGVAATLLSLVDSLTIVATSRIPLGVDGERLVVLRPLALPLSDDPIELEASAAVRLFRDRAAAVGVHVGSTAMQLSDVGRVVRDLDGLPLAIELAAARVRALGFGDLLKLLERRLDLLRRPEGASSPTQSSMRAVLDTSFELLDEPDRRLLRWLSVFPGPVALDMVHLVCGAEGADEIDTLDGLGRLVACSLLVAERDESLTRYRMYETVRAYAAERLVAAGEQEIVQQRYADALAGMADSFVAQAAQQWSAALVERMLGCFDNLVGAVEVCLAGDADGSRAFRLFLPLYAAVHGDRPADVAALGHRMLARWPHGGEPLRAEAIAVTAAGALLAGRDREALEMADQSVAIPGASPLVAVLADRVRGFAAHYHGDRSAAIAHLESARHHAASWSGPLARELTVALSSVRGAGPEAELALSDLAGVATEAGALDEHATEIWARIAAGHLLVRLDRIDESRREAAAARLLAERVTHPWGLASSLRLLAVLEALERGWDSARPAWRTTLAQVAESGDLEAAALTIRVAASAALRSGRHDEAVALFEPLPRRSGRTVLPPVLDAEASELERVVVPAPASTIADAVHRARAILHEADRDGGRSALAADRRHLGGPRTNAAPDDAQLVRLGDTWSVTWAGTTASVRDVKGIRAVGRLLAQPNKELHCVELMDGAQHDGDTGPVVDRAARRSYEARIRELQADVDEATAHNDLARMERAEAELDALVEHLTGALGLGGRARTTGQVVERARSAARWRLQSAIKRIAEVHPDLGRHLRNSITTGIWCAYRPEQPVRWHVDETIAPATESFSDGDSGRSR